MGGVAGLAGVEFAASQHDGTDTQELADVGKPSEVALQALAHLDDGQLGATPAADAGERTAGPDAAAAEDGLSIWRDLPPEA